MHTRNCVAAENHHLSDKIKRAFNKFLVITTTSEVMANILWPLMTGNMTESLVNETQLSVTPSADKELARLLNLVIRPVLIVFGTIGNGLSFYIMRQDSMKKMSTCFYLSIIAVSDTSKWLYYIISKSTRLLGISALCAFIFPI